MRISDWSSDVCSSDLATPLEHVPGYYREELAHLAATERVVHLIAIVLRRTSLAYVGGMTPENLREITDAVADALGWEIGNAAWWGGVCQIVEISVVAVSLQNR